MQKIPHLYYVDAIEGSDHFGNRHPVDFIVDVSEHFETKIESLACHASQREWLRRQHGLDEYLDACRRWSEKRSCWRKFRTRVDMGFICTRQQRRSAFRALK